MIIKLLKQYKPKEIHVRIGAPKILNPCYYGIDIPVKEELIMNKFTEESFSKKNGLNSLKFLELKNYDSVLSKLNNSLNNFCTACFNNKYLDIYDF